MHLGRTPEVCVAQAASAGHLPVNGALLHVGAILFTGSLLLVAGAIMLISRRRRELRRTGAGRGGTGAALGVLMGALLLTPLTDTSADAAAEGAVTYSEGCTVLELSVVPDTDTGALNLLPGDVVTVLTATVTNRAAFPIEITADAALESAGEAGLADTFVLSATIDGGPAGPAELAAGESVDVVVDVRLPAETDNALQGRLAPVVLTVMGSER